jgi:hypothetical protein
MASQDYHSSVQAYYQAIATLYARPVTAMVERGEGDIRPAPDLDERVQVVIDRSQELGESAARGQASADPDQRELAELQLLAAAAIDLHIASDFVRLAEEGVSEEVRERSVSLPGVMVELRAILNADPAGGYGRCWHKSWPLSERRRHPVSRQPSKRCAKRSRGH